jgi:predicted O-methyltransferase YrrM
MVSALEYIGQKFGVDIHRKPPIEIFSINRVIMAQTLNELGVKVGAEIGVQRGNHARMLCENIPGLKLYCVDYWDFYPNYFDFTKSLQVEKAKAEQVLAPYDCPFIEKFSMDALADFEDESLDFVYIDAGHDWKNIANDVYEWPKKVRKGGIVFGHDFKRTPRNAFQNAVRDVVPAYMYHFKIRPWFILGAPGPRDHLYQEGTQAWMFVKG